MDKGVQIIEVLLYSEISDKGHGQSGPDLRSIDPEMRPPLFKGPSIVDNLCTKNTTLAHTLTFEIRDNLTTKDKIDVIPVRPLFRGFVTNNVRGRESKPAHCVGRCDASIESTWQAGKMWTPLFTQFSLPSNSSTAGPQAQTIQTNLRLCSHILHEQQYLLFCMGA